MQKSRHFSKLFLSPSLAVFFFFVGICDESERRAQKSAPLTYVTLYLIFLDASVRKSYTDTAAQEFTHLTALGSGNR